MSIKVVSEITNNKQKYNTINFNLRIFLILKNFDFSMLLGIFIALMVNIVTIKIFHLRYHIAIIFTCIVIIVLISKIKKTCILLDDDLANSAKEKDGQQKDTTVIIPQYERLSKSYVRKRQVYQSVTFLFFLLITSFIAILLLLLSYNVKFISGSQKEFNINQSQAESRIFNTNETTKNDLNTERIITSYNETCDLHLKESHIKSILKHNDQLNDLFLNDIIMEEISIIKESD